MRQRPREVFKLFFPSYSLFIKYLSQNFVEDWPNWNPEMKGTSFKTYISPVFLIYEATLILNMVPISPHSSTVIDKVFQGKKPLKKRTQKFDCHCPIEM